MCVELEKKAEEREKRAKEREKRAEEREKRLEAVVARLDKLLDEHFADGDISAGGSYIGCEGCIGGYGSIRPPAWERAVQRREAKRRAATTQGEK